MNLIANHSVLIGAAIAAIALAVTALYASSRQKHVEAHWEARRRKGSTHRNARLWKSEGELRRNKARLFACASIAWILLIGYLIAASASK